MQSFTTENLLSGINQWVAVESKSDNLAGLASMMDLAQADFQSAGLVTERIPGIDGFYDTGLTLTRG